MKNLILLMLIALLGFSSSLYSQNSDTTRIRIGSKRIIIIEEGDDNNIEVEIHGDSLETEFDIDIDELKALEEKGKKNKSQKFDGHWEGFQFGFTGLVNANNEQPNGDDWMSVNPARSWTFGLNLFQTDIPLIKENFGIVAGLGIKWRNLHFDNNIDLQETEDGVTGVFIPMEEREYTKNRLQATYLDGMIGLELQFPVGKKNTEMFLQGGAYGSYKMGSNYVQKWEENDNEGDNKLKDDYYLTDLEYGLTARIGIGDINLFANYSLTPLFRDKGQAPEFFPVTVGLMIVGF